MGRELGWEKIRFTQRMQMTWLLLAEKEDEMRSMIGRLEEYVDKKSLKLKLYNRIYRYEVFIFCTVFSWI